ncbi:hypothetical protein P8C59_000243 [Phyllachora maydis]|uniref:BZIP domain-containing protein n=1 Tax=Phyllachora maydis TaxID=1825666 RepID=A0AAD9M644_9PEZI|nr:hypothetical protein P8C59_000243 [Phyllachora maydis]
MDDEMASGAQAGSPEPESEESHVDSALQFLEDSTIERARDWELEGDATQLLWTCRESQKNEEAAAQIRRRNEARRRKAEQRLALLRPSGAQQLQPAFLSSPPRAASPRQTRTQSQGSGPSDLPVFSQPMSQVVPGVFGGRPPIAKRRKIRRETRSQGFRSVAAHEWLLAVTTLRHRITRSRASK